MTTLYVASVSRHQEPLMPTNIQGCKVAILATDGVEQVEITEPMRALRDAGAEVSVVAPKPGQIQAMNHDVEAAQKIPVDADLASARPDGFDALVLPGGTTNPDKLRIVPEAVAFVAHFVESGKPIAAICHGPWTLIEAGGVSGKRMTSWPSLRTDLRNAGATWVDEAFVRDGAFATSRGPQDLGQFCPGAVQLFAEVRSRRAA
jgi:protease I